MIRKKGGRETMISLGLEFFMLISSEQFLHCFKFSPAPSNSYSHFSFQCFLSFISLFTSSSPPLPFPPPLLHSFGLAMFHALVSHKTYPGADRFTCRGFVTSKVLESCIGTYRFIFYDNIYLAT